MSRREKREREEIEEKEKKKKEKELHKQEKLEEKSKKKTEKKKHQKDDVLEDKKKKSKKTDNDEEKKKKHQKETAQEKEQPKKNKKADDSEEIKEKKVKNKKKSNKKSKITVGKVFKTIFSVIFILILLGFIFLEGYVIKTGNEHNWESKKMVKEAVKDVALAITGQTEADIANLEPIYCLIVGISTDEGTTLTDTIIVAAYYPRTQQASMLSIPRDTFVGKSESTAGGYDKINAQYTAGGIQRLLERVNKFTGLNISNYVIVKNEGLIQVVDAIGGVEFNVPIDMDYDDPGQNLHIHLKKGMQRLEGWQAEGLVRFRHNNDNSTYPAEYGDNDIGRMRTQREFIKETAKQTLRVGNISKINELMKIAFDNVETNVDLNYAMKYSPAIIDFDVSAIQSGNLPGKAERFGPQNAWFFKVNEKETKELVKKLFTFKQETYESGEEGVVPLQPENINLKVLNGSGNEKIIKETIKKLEEKGYNVVEEGITTITNSTKVINRTEKKPEVVDELISTLGSGTEVTGNDEGNYDFTIIIGRDLDK